jgi:hypothetical protein
MTGVPLLLERPDSRIQSLNTAISDSIGNAATSSVIPSLAALDLEMVIDTGPGWVQHNP